MSRSHQPVPTLVIGVGNILWADEGFGVRCVEALARQYDLPDWVSVVDGGTQGLYLVDLFRDHRRVIIFDAVDFGDQPGDLRVVKDDAIPAFVAGKKVSLHQAGLQDVIACAKLLGGCADEMVLIGVQPVDLEDYGGSLTEPVRTRIPDAVAIGLETLATWNVPFRRRDDKDTSGDGTVMAPGLSLERYERGRPPADTACRIGDARVLVRQS